jgi:hypothetical protein
MDVKYSLRAGLMPTPELSIQLKGRFNANTLMTIQ